MDFPMIIGMEAACHTEEDSERLTFVERVAWLAMMEARIIDQPPISYVRRTHKRLNRGQRARLREEASEFGVSVDDIAVELPQVSREMFVSQDLQRKRAELAHTVLKRLFTVPKR